MPRSDMTETENARAFRGLAGQLATGVAIILVLAEGNLQATTVGSTVVASFDPPLVATFVAVGSRTERHISEAGRFTINLLGVDDHALASRLARPGRVRGWAAFDPEELLVRDEGPPLLASAIAWLDCGLERVVAVGDHSLLVGAVLEFGRQPDLEPLVYYRGRFRRLGPVVGPGRQVSPDEADLLATW